jgi:hypothetical protein
MKDMSRETISSFWVNFSNVADFFLSATGFSYFSEFWNWIDMLVITGISE